METWRQRFKRLRETYFGNIWDTLAWVAFAYVVIYALLKVLGVLHSPVEVDVGLIISAAYFLGKSAQKLDFSVKEIEAVKHSVLRLEGKFNEHDVRLVRIETKLA